MRLGAAAKARRQANALAGREARPERDLISRAEALIAATKAAFRISGERAFYVPAADLIQVPPQPAFFAHRAFSSDVDVEQRG